MKKLACMTAILAIFLTLWGCGNSEEKMVMLNPEESPVGVIDNTYEDVSEIYTTDYQNNAKDQIQEMVDQAETRDLFESPIVIANPYGTITNGLYLNFTTEKKACIVYNVAAEGYGDFTRSLYNPNGEYATEHEYLLIGCVPGEENHITLTASDEEENLLGVYSFYYKAPELLNDKAPIQATITKGESKESLAKGLYTVLGNDTTEDEEDEEYAALYDNNGVIRCEMPIISFRAHEFIFDEKGVYFSITSGALARMDRTGYVNGIYGMGDFKLHHDYLFGSKNDILVLASSRDSISKDDRIISVDIDTKAVTQVVDLAKLFPDYVSQMKIPQGAETLDWMHVNSIDMLDEDSIIISARETSTIICIDNIYDEPTVRYMIGSDEFWAGTGYEDLLLAQKGSFCLQGGQHSVIYTPDNSLMDGQYYLILYNNNNTYSLQRKDYNWAADSNYYDTGVAVDSRGNPSYYYKYLVDENAGTFELVESIPVGYSGFVSSVQEVEENLVVDSGGCFTTYEFDKEGKMIQQLVYDGSKWIYRTKKYTYEGFWFQEGTLTEED